MIRKALFFIFSGALFFIHPSSSFAQKSEPSSGLRLSLQDCLKIALQNNARIAVRDYAIEAAQWRHEETNIRFYPMVEVSNRSAPVPKNAQQAAQSFFEGDVTYLNASKIAVGLPVYGFGQLAVAQELTEKGVEAAHAEKEKDEIKIQSEVKQLYYAILLGGDLSDIAQDAINKINNQLKKEEETHAHSPYEILKLKVFKLDLEKRFEEAQNKLAFAKHALGIQLGLAEGKNIELTEHDLTLQPYDFKTIEDYLPAAAESRPEANLASLGVEAKRLEYELEKKKLFPKIGVGGFFEIARTAEHVNNVGPTDAFTNPFNYTRAGVGLEIKGQFDIHGSSAKIHRLDSEYQKAAMEKSLAGQGISLEVEETFHEAQRLKTNVAKAEEKEKMAHQMMFLSKSNLDIGVGTEQEYTDSLQLYLLSQGEYLKTVFDYNVALAKLEEKVGRRDQNEP